MTLHVALTHKTEYRYDRPTGMGPQIIRLRPAPHCRTPILCYSLTLTPKQHFLNWQQDPFGNYLARLVVPEQTREFSVTVDLIADMAVINPFDFFVDEYARTWPFAYEPALRQELGPYLELLPACPLFLEYFETLKFSDELSIDFLVALNRRLQQDIRYLIRMEPGVQTPDETLERRSGSCRDSGWLLVQILRRFGLAARFVSGYLIQLTADVKALDGPTGTEHDFTDLHAWAEVYLPGAGWIGLDPTSGLLAGEGHIPLAATPSPISAAPITGAHDEAEVDFSFDMKVRRIVESPRVTKPYSDEQWAAIASAGHEVDRRLQAGDVRLSMGGEPTFVSAMDMEGAEWNTAAVGPTKRRYAEDLVRRLRRRFAPGGLLHYGQGKWYPGEQLPRWAFAVHWRADGEPLWQDETLIESETNEATPSAEEAQRFAAHLTGKLGLPEDSAIPAYEDPAHFLLIEQKLPLNLDAETNQLENPAERARLIRVFDRGLGEPVSYVLPVQVWHSQERGRQWVTERWKFRREKLFLIPGDSPAGFRLPIGGLPHIMPVDYPDVVPSDPMGQQWRPLPRREVLLTHRRAATLEAPLVTPAAPTEVVGSVRTALVIEPRDGHLHIFTPPLEDAEDYAALIAAIEEAAIATGTKIHIEGYAPPHDPRLNVIKVTPDPGVIEVNIHPATNWDDAVAITTALYEEAHLARLGTEKFMIDGRHSGTGGGNHIVLGGPTPADSPFLRRPDLLGSLIACWQNHPSLSYLFSGLFIGPTSQAPRIDEARHEQLYEMEIALNQIPDATGYTPPWLVDRIFRNLLVDVTGNTHRVEICIDKLYSPEGPTGRLGLVEFRSFEMPPHARMSLAQQLLLRALVARFWEKPYRSKLVRWGTELHDRFMLPHFVWEDFLGVVEDLQVHGFPIAAEWFAPHFEFRFPVYRTVEHGGLELELRQALEPWHVLGEESVVGGTARYVDSSLERVQVKVSRMIGERYAVLCNGHALPLTSTGRNGEYVAGVRFRAWQPAASLHPAIAPHTPLVFDIVDCWNGRSVGGCRYHVAHPGGRAFDTFPINAYEAEGRRRARFEAIGHTPWQAQVPPLRVNAEYPMTLDLRLSG